MKPIALSNELTPSIKERGSMLQVVAISDDTGCFGPSYMRLSLTCNQLDYS